MTQQEQILWRLQRMNTCGTTFLSMHIPRYAARIHELRNKGYWISSERCNDPRHKTPQTLYILVSEPE